MKNVLQEIQQYFLTGSLVCLVVFTACRHKPVIITEAQPVYITDTTPNDTDDPAIWINKTHPEKSLIIGTDKGDSTGGIFVFDLKGKLIPSLCLRNLSRPNNMDVEYGFRYQQNIIDIAVFTERGKNKIRVVAVPDFKFIDNGGIEVFVGEADSLRQPMGIGLYRDKENNIYAFVSRKNGPKTGYIHQYQLFCKDSAVEAKFIRKFGEFSGVKEIESIVVDDELGYIYYSDEGVGVRKYYADAHKGNRQLALFATTGISQDHEGLSIYSLSNGKGYIILSDQQANEFHVFSRKGSWFNPHNHKLLKIVKAKTDESDGSEITSFPLNADFPKGIFVAMSSDKTFQYYRAEDILP